MASASQNASLASLKTINGGPKWRTKEDGSLRENTKDFDRRSETGRSVKDVDARSDIMRSRLTLDARSDIMKSPGDIDIRSTRDLDIRSTRDLDIKSAGDLDIKSVRDLDAKSIRDLDGKSIRDQDSKSIRDLDAKSIRSHRDLDRKSESVKVDAISMKHDAISKKSLVPRDNVNLSRVSLSSQPVDITKCPICAKDMASPKTLPCLHTFCELCIAHHAASCLSSDKGGQITCPVCTSPVTTPRTVTDPYEFAASLPINHFVSSLMVQSFVKQKLCKPCQKTKKNTPAVTWCTYCAETLCPEHDAYHRSLTSSDVHHVITIEEIQEDSLVSYAPGMCKKHDERLTFYCEFHRELACEACRKTIHRMCDDLTTTERAADSLKASPETTTLLRILDTADVQTNEIVEGRKQNIKELEEGKKRETETIAQFREEVNRHLDMLEQGMKDELDKKHTQKTKELKKEVDTFQMNRNTIAYYKSLLELLLRNGSGIQVIMELSKVRDQCKILEDKIRHRASKIKRVAYDIKQNDITSKMDSLGNIEFTHTAVVTTPAPEEWHKLRGKKSQARAHPVRENTHDFLVLRYSSSKITGGTSMRSKLLLVDRGGREFRAYNEVGHRDESLAFSFKRSPFDITALPQRDGVDMVAVTMPDEKTIEIIECGGTPVMEKHHYKTQNNCHGITYVEGQVIVACLSGLEICELIEDHKLVFRAFLDLGLKKIENVHAVDKSRFYYTDSTDHGSLYCITPDGTEIFEYCNSNLRKPTGISTDSGGNVYVAGYQSNNIHQLSPEGALLHVITPRSRTFYKPTVLIEHENRMYSVFGKHKVIVFT